jgi:hypothetical protein
MSIQKKSLISTLKTAKKANVASGSTHEVDAKGSKVASMRQVHAKNSISAKNTVSLMKITAKNAINAKNTVSLKKNVSFKKA